jgi:hypothetical protein
MTNTAARMDAQSLTGAAEPVVTTIYVAVMESLRSYTGD